VNVLASRIGSTDNGGMELPIEPDPVIEAYKKDVDRTLLRENLKLTVQERVEQLVATLRFDEELRAAVLRRRDAS
jgi:hypothetical protein